VDSLQKVVDQMEQDQAVMGKKIQRLQESVKSQKKVLYSLSERILFRPCTHAVYDTSSV